MKAIRLADKIRGTFWDSVEFESDCVKSRTISIIGDFVFHGGSVMLLRTATERGIAHEEGFG